VFDAMLRAFVAIGIFALLQVHSSCVAAEASSSATDSLPAISSDKIIGQNNEIIATVYPTQLNNNGLKIYKETGSVNPNHYTYLPYSYVDWPVFTAEVDKTCVPDSAGVQHVRMMVEFYWPELTAEIKKLVSQQVLTSVADLSIGIPQNVGVIGFAYDSANNPFQTINSIPQAALLKGVPLTAESAGTPASMNGWIDANCRDLKSIAQRQTLVALMFAVGAKAKVSQLTAIADSLLRSGFLSNLSEDESQVRKTTVSSTGGGSDIAVNVGPFGLGDSSSSATTTTDEQKYRIINRAWFDSNFEKAMNNVDISTKR
jgi:hypothetical protein